jgi:hypothetical protein
LAQAQNFDFDTIYQQRSKYCRKRSEQNICLMCCEIVQIRDVNPGSRIEIFPSLIPDPGVTKAPKPGLRTDPQ